MGRISMPQGKGSQLHNKREYDRIGKPLPDHIDPGRIHENLNVVDIPLRKAYDQIFGNAIREYNARQKRADRKIKDYLEHIQKSKNGEKLYYEDIVQWGALEDFAADPGLREVAKAALYQYATTFQDRNPNLRLIGAYIHMDEASPHLHIDYIPVATGYKNGLPIRNSLDRAMKEMGITPESGTESRHNNATKLWKERERAFFGSICESMGLTVDSERQGHEKHLTAAEYADIARRAGAEAHAEASKIVSEAKEVKRRVETLEKEFRAKEAILEASEEAGKPTTLYPIGVKLKTKGLIFRKEFVVVPKELWEARTLSSAAYKGMRQERRELDRAWSEYKYSAAGQALTAETKRKKELEGTVQQLQTENRSLQQKLTEAEKENARLLDKINRVLQMLPQEVGKAFRKIWETIDQHVFRHNRGL